MIAPYQTPYGLREFRLALRGLSRPFPNVDPDWFPAFRGQGVHVLPTNRGREGHYALLRALNLPPRARVGVPILTHPVVWQTVAAAGMQPVFLDTDPVAFGLSLADLRKKNAGLDCLILTHTFGYPADFEAVAAIMQGKPILEDCAHTLGSTYRGRPLGSLGDGSFFTFLFSKPLRAGGGGCAIARAPRVAQEVEKLLRAGPEETVLQGLSHAVENLLLCLAYQPLCYRLLTLLTSSRFYKRASSTVNYPVSPALRMRRSDWDVVASRLRAWNVDTERNSEFWTEIRARLPEGWHIPPEPEWGEWNHWLMPVCPPSPEAASRGIAKLRSHGIGARLIYLYSPEGGRPYGYAGDCPEAERLSRCIFVLPSHSGLTPAQRDHIVKCMARLCGQPIGLTEGQPRLTVESAG